MINRTPGRSTTLTPPSGTPLVDPVPSRPSWINLRVADTTPAEARTFAASVILGHAKGDYADNVLLVVSELITNALATARRLVEDGGHRPWGDNEKPIRLGVLSTDSQTEVFVRDPNPAPIIREDPDEELPEHGRGLFIVEVLSTDWWVDYEADGKTVRAIIAAPDDVETLSR